MVSCFFRFLKDGEVSDIGFVQAKDRKDLFWKIDEFCVPYDVEVKEVDDGFLMLFRPMRRNGVSDFGGVDFGMHGADRLLSNDGWVKPEVTEDCEMILPWNASHE